MTFAWDFFKSKTTWASITTIITTIGGALTHQINPFHAALVCLGVIHLPFLRDAWVKGIEEVLTALEGMQQGPQADGGEVRP